MARPLTPQTETEVEVEVEVEVEGRAWRRSAASAVVLSLALAGCSSVSVGTPVGAARSPDVTATAQASPVTLATVDGWTDGQEAVSAFALVEVAYDAAAARALWDEAVPADLPAAEDDPWSPGSRASLDDVDLATHALVLVTSGQSSSCPSRVTAVSRAGATGSPGEIAVTVDSDPEHDACTDDYTPYRTLLAVDRSVLPAESEIRTTGAVVLSGSLRLDAEIQEYQP